MEQLSYRPVPEPTPVRKDFKLLPTKSLPGGFSTIYLDTSDPSLPRPGHPKVPSGGMNYEGTVRGDEVRKYNLTLTPKVIGTGKEVLDRALQEAGSDTAHAVAVGFYDWLSGFQAEFFKPDPEELPEGELPVEELQVKDKGNIYYIMQKSFVWPYPNDHRVYEKDTDEETIFEVLMTNTVYLGEGIPTLWASLGIERIKTDFLSDITAPIRAELAKGNVSRAVVDPHLKFYLRLMTLNDPYLDNFGA